MSEKLEKRSKNVRQQTRNLTPQQVIMRRIKYAQSLGLQPRARMDEEDNGLFPQHTNNVLQHDPADEGDFNLTHELGHALMTPPGGNLQQHNRDIAYVDDADEDAAMAVEKKIMRRAGTSPEQHDDGIVRPPRSNSRPRFDPYSRKAAATSIAPYDNGAKFNHKGDVLPPTGPDAKINERAMKKNEQFMHALPEDIYDAEMQVKGKWHPAGRFMTHGNHLSILSDYHNGLLGHTLPEGPVDDYTAAKVLDPGPHLRFHSRGDIKAGKKLDAIPEAKLDELPPPAVAPELNVSVKPHSVFSYQHIAHEKPHVVHFQDGIGHIDGQPMERSEVANLLAHVKGGRATLRYRDSRHQELTKFEAAFRALAKGEGDMDPAEALKHVEAASAAGHVPPEVLKALRRHVYEDKMTPGLGNKFAWQEFSKSPRPGVHVALDANGLKTLNDVHGHEAGDAAIQALGRHIREAADEVAPPGRPGGAKAFRTDNNAYRFGGDEFVVHLPSHEHAARFARSLNGRLQQIPPINGVHKLSVSMGFGNDFHGADTALYQAKEAKKKHLQENPGITVGQLPSFAHSLVPGSEGPVPVDTAQLPLHATPKGQTHVQLPPTPEAPPETPPTAPAPQPAK